MLHKAATPLQRMCDQCGAPVARGSSCAERFDRLLALDHSRAEPWGSRHGLAFAAFTLQHTRDASTKQVQRCLEILHRVYRLGEDRTHVVNSFRGESSGETTASIIAPDQTVPNIFAFTIEDMAGFAAESYVANLEAWCRATLAAWLQ